MSRIKEIVNDPGIKHAINGIAVRFSEIIDLIISIQQIPAPTFQESKRALYIEKCFSGLGLRDVHQDKLHNVYAHLPGSITASRSPIIVSAHSDTVFPLNTNLKTIREGNLLFGPGIADNAAGVAGIISLAKLLINYNLTPKSDIWFVANVGEEGLGNLRGMCEVVEKFGEGAQYIVVEGGSFGQIIHEAIGVSRFRIAIEAPGGHSWGSFGKPSAVHELGKLIAEITDIAVPTTPRTTYNIGVIEGGTTINSIASSASLLLDLRSEDAVALENLVQQVENIVQTRQRAAEKYAEDVQFNMVQVGHRPAGRLKRNHPFVKLAKDSLYQVGWPHVTNTAGSTDANIPLSRNMPAVCVGLATSGNSHRLDEFIDLTHLQAGMQQLLLLVWSIAEIEQS